MHVLAVNLLTSRPVVAIDWTSYSPNTSFKGAEWFGVLISLGLGILVLISVLAIVFGAIKGVKNSIGGRQAGVGDAAWTIGGGFIGLVLSGSLLALVASWINLFPKL